MSKKKKETTKKPKKKEDSLSIDGSLEEVLKVSVPPSKKKKK